MDLLVDTSKLIKKIKVNAKLIDSDAKDILEDGREASVGGKTATDEMSNSDINSPLNVTFDSPVLKNKQFQKKKKSKENNIRHPRILAWEKIMKIVHEVNTTIIAQGQQI